MKSGIFYCQAERKIKDLHQALSDYAFISSNPASAYEQYTSNAYWFYQNLLAPALEKNKNASDIKNLLIISDGLLGHLPFEVFLVDKPNQQSGNSYPTWSLPASVVGGSSFFASAAARASRNAGGVQSTESLVFQSGVGGGISRGTAIVSGDAKKEFESSGTSKATRKCIKP